MRAWCCRLGLGLGLLAGGATAAPRPLDVTDIATPTFNVYSADDGLSDEIWSTVGFDRDGFVWAGSASSLARFDGYRWTAWPLPQARSLVRDMISDDQGTLWTLFEREGLARYDGQTWQLLGESQLLHRFSRTQRSDGRAEYWVSFDRGLLQLDADQWRKDPGASVASGRVTAIAETQTLFGEARQWLGVGGGAQGLWYRRIGDRRAPEPWRLFEASETHSFDTTSLLRTVDRGREVLWALSYGGGLVRLREDGIRVWRAERGELPSEAIYTAVTTTAKDGSSTLWAASRGGLLRVRGDEIVSYDRRHGLPSDSIRGIKLQRVGDLDVLWVATEGGMARYVMTQNAWQAVSLHGVRENGVFGLLIEPDAQGGERLWVGSAKRGLAMLEHGQWRVFERTNDGLMLENIRQIKRLPGPDGQDWRLLSLMGGHLLRIDEQFNFQPLSVPWPKRAEEGVASMFAHSNGQGELWFGMMRGGIYRLREGQWTHFMVPQAPSAWTVFAFCEQFDALGQRWLWAASDRGLARFDGTDWQLLPDHFGLQDGLRGLALVPGPKGPELWLGSNRLGLLRLDVSAPLNPRLISDTRVPPAADSVVYSILRDSQGRIYLCTNNGVQQLLPRDDGGYRERVFRRRDGLIHDECNTNSQLLDEHDRYWVGTLGGLGMFDPRATATPARGSHPLRLTDVRIDGKAVTATAGQIVVPAGAREVRVEYALLSGQRETESLYRSYLHGYEPAPSDFVAERSRVFSRLAPGSYDFTVDARDYSGSASAPLRLTLQVQALWWQHPIARVLAGLLLVLLLAALLFLYNHQLRRQKSRLQKLITERTAELHEANLQLTELSYLDALTGVANRRRLMEAIDVAIHRAVDLRKPVGLILVDVDHFKQYNDQHGHLVGDLALRAVAQCLRGVLREQDLVARYGGEEFACLLVDADSATVNRIAEQMRAGVAALPPRAIGNAQQTLTISVGFLSANLPSREPATRLIEAADQALYRAKAEGRNCVREGRLEHSEPPHDQRL